MRGQAVDIGSSTSNEWLITGIQLEIGDVATPFEHEDFGTTLAKCERYAATLGGLTLSKMREADRLRNATYKFPSTMRAAPTIPAMTDGSSLSVLVQSITTGSCLCFGTVTADGYGSETPTGTVISAEVYT